MSSPRMKLPSIAELTSSTRSSTSSDGSPLSSFQAAPPTGSSMSSGFKRASISGASSSSLSPLAYSHNLNENMFPSVANKYGVTQRRHYSYESPSLVKAPHHQEFSQPVFMQSGVPASTGGRVYLPAHELNKVYNVPEVVNKPMNECHRCGTTETPEWRRGPNGLRTLCNACGLFHAKLVKRKGAAVAAEEVLNNKVYKGKNGRRVCVKRQAKNDLRKLREAQVTEIPPILHTPLQTAYMTPSYSPQRHSHEAMHQIPRYQQAHQPQVLHQYLHQHPHPNLHQLRPFAAALPVFPQHTGAGMMSPPKLSHPEHSISTLRY